MQIRKLFDEKRAVSPVIGVILMVAITVILAAVIGTFVLGLGDQVQKTSPQASFSFEYDSDDSTLTITHDGGDQIGASDLSIKTTGATPGSIGSWSPTPVSAGSSVTLSSYSPSTGDTVRVVWSSDSADTSATLGKWTAP